MWAHSAGCASRGLCFWFLKCVFCVSSLKQDRFGYPMGKYWGCNQCLLLIRILVCGRSPTSEVLQHFLAQAEGSSGNIPGVWLRKGLWCCKAEPPCRCWELSFAERSQENWSQTGWVTPLTLATAVQDAWTPTNFLGFHAHPGAVALFPQLRTPPTLPCLQHTDPNTSQRTQGRGSCMDWPFPVAEAKFPGVKGFHIHRVHYWSMAPDWNSWFTQGLVNRDLACLVFSPCSLQVDDSSNHDNIFVFSSCSSAVQEYYSEKKKKPKKTQL